MSEVVPPAVDSRYDEVPNNGERKKWMLVLRDGNKREGH